MNYCKKAIINHHENFHQEPQSTEQTPITRVFLSGTHFSAEWTETMRISVGWVGAGLEVVDGIHVVQSQEELFTCQRCRNTSKVRGEYTDDIRPYRLPGAQLLVVSCRNKSVFG